MLRCSEEIIQSSQHQFVFHFHCRVEIKDVCLAREMQRVMAAEAEATRDARAKVKMLDFSTDVDKKCR